MLAADYVPKSTSGTVSSSRAPGCNAPSREPEREERAWARAGDSRQRHLAPGQG